MTDRKKPGVAFWATVVVTVVLLYVASFGPACWITSRTKIGAAFVSTVYQPILMVEVSPLAEAMSWYAYVGAPDDWARTSDSEVGPWEWEPIIR